MDNVNVKDLISIVHICLDIYVLYIFVFNNYSVYSYPHNAADTQ